MLYVEPTQLDLTDPVHVAIPDEKAFFVRTLLNYDVPHYFARFSIAGCPPGLEILDKYQNLLVTRRLQNYMNVEPKKRYEAYSQFDIKNSRGMQLYLALEDIESHAQLKWTRDARLANVSFYDFHCRRVFTVKRICSCNYFFAQYLCLFCMYGFQGCGNAAEVYLSDDSLLGTIKQKLSFSSTIFNIYNSSGKCILVIDGIVSDGILDVTYPDDDEPIAMIETLMTDQEALDFYKVTVPRFSTPCGITFFKNFITPEQKALLLSVAVLLDFMLLQPTSDYPHLAQVIPDDFHNLPSPYAYLHQDGSQEILLLMEKEKTRKRKPKGKWSCCKWCGRLMCIFCILAIKRNAVRFILLLFGIVLAIIFLILLSRMFTAIFSTA